MIKNKIDKIDYNKKYDFIINNNNFIYDNTILILLINYLNNNIKIERLDIFSNRFTIYYLNKNKKKTINFRFDFLHIDNEYLYICENKNENKNFLRKIKLKKIYNVYI